MASGNEYSPKELPPRASMASIRASMSGWSGTAKGRRVMMTLLRASPGTSTPCQKLSVPNSTESTSSLNFSSMVERGVPVPCTMSAMPSSSKSGCIRPARSCMSL